MKQTAENCLTKVALEPTTQAEADETENRVMNQLMNADNSTLRDIVLLMAGNMVELTALPCDENTFSVSAFGIIQDVADTVSMAEIVEVGHS